MKIVYINYENCNLPKFNGPYHTCNVCGFVFPWTETHRGIERPVGSGIYGYEALFITCSDDCRIIQRDFFIKWLSSFDEWTEITAADNYDRFIK